LGAKRGPGKSLTQEERAHLSSEALEKWGRGISKKQIAKELGVSFQTVQSLLRYAAAQIDAEEKVEIRAQIVASIRAVKRRAWDELDRRRAPDRSKGATGEPGARIIQPTSHTLPALLQRILEADDRLIRLYGLDQRGSDERSTESLVDQMKAYEEAKRTGKLAEIRAGGAWEDGS
jgi:DNA-binding CsgD family transcriptional regulator